jgi:serine/threonine protein kinase
MGDNWESRSTKPMICCLNPHCPQASPSCADGTNYCPSCRTQLVLLSDRYRPIKKIGHGGFGVTYLAEDREMFDSHCVIKQLIQHDDTAKQWFEREALKLRELGSESSKIPRLLAYSSDSNYLYLVQEFISGQDLNKYLEQQGIFKEEQVKDFLKEILPVLSLIHEKKIIHRDIKLDNIMRRNDGQIVLIDFGTAKQLSSNHTPAPGTSIGTWGYVAPEQMMQGIVKPASDLYSLGAACFHLLTGVHPATAFQVNGFEWTKDWQRYLKQTISKEFSNIIDKLLRFDHEDRYQSAEVVLKSLHPSTPVPGPLPTTLSSPPVNQGNAFRPSINYLNLWILMSIVSFFVFVTIAIKLITASTSSDSQPVLIDKNPVTAEDYNDQGVAKANAGDRRGAIKDYTTALELKSNYPDAYHNRGIAHANSSEWKEAIDDYNRAISLKVDSPDIYYNRGVSRYNLGDKKGAAKDYTEAIRIDPSYLNAYINRCVIQHDLGNNKGAIEDCNKAIKLKPDNPDSYNNRGNARTDSDDKRGAIEDYTKAINLKSDYPEAYHNRGTARADTGDKKGAIEDYTKAINLKANYPEAHHNRGLARFNSGDKKGAIEDYKEAAAQYKQEGRNANTDKDYKNLLLLLKEVGESTSNYTQSGKK